MTELLQSEVTYALSRANGTAEAIIEAEKLKLTDSHFCYVLLGNLQGEIDNDKEKAHFETAYSLAKTETVVLSQENFGCDLNCRSKPAPFDNI